MTRKGKRKTKLFVETMFDLFDITQYDGLGQIKIEDGRKFLMHRQQKGLPGSIFGVNQKLNKTQGRNSTVAHRNGNCQGKKAYEEIKQRFDTYQFVTSETDDSSSQISGGDDDSVNSSIIVQQLSATVKTAATATVPTSRIILQILLPVSLKILTDDKSLREMAFTY